MPTGVVAKPSSAALQPEQQKFTKFVVIQLVLLLLGYTFYALNRYAFPIGLRDIGRTFHFTAVETSALGTAFLLGQGIIDIPAGYLAGKLNRRFLFFLGMFGVGATVIGFIVFTRSFASAVIWRVAFGIMEGIFNICLFAFLGIFLPKRRALLNNIALSFFGVGAFVGPVLFGVLSGNSGNWKYPLGMFGIATMIYALILLAFVRVHEKNISSLAFSKMHAPVGETFFSAFATVVRLPSMWKALTIPILNLISAWSFAGLGAYMLVNSKHINTAFAGTLIGTAFGLHFFLCPFVGYLADRFGRRPVVVGLAVMSMLSIYTLFISDVTNHPLLLVAAFLAGLGLNSNYAMGYTVVQDAVPAIYVGFATGMTGALGYFLASFSGYFIGLVTKSFGYYMAVYIILIGSAFCVAICALIFVPSKRKADELAAQS